MYKTRKIKDAEALIEDLTPRIAHTQELIAINQVKYEELKVISYLEGATEEQIIETADALELVNANINQLATLQAELAELQIKLAEA